MASVRKETNVAPRPRRSSVWWQMVGGMRAYGVAITSIWALSATSVLVVLAIAASTAWLQVALGGAAVVELALSILTVAFLRRASVSGRFDV
jgi:hypothetical protein